jgi:hypothetical protein
MTGDRAPLALLADWFPLLLLIAVWIFFMWQTRRGGGPAQQSLAGMRRRNGALDKILASHEARLQELEDGRRR